MKLKMLLSLCGAGFLLVMCGVSGCIPGEKGTLKLNITDQAGDYEEVYITFSEIFVHRGEEQDIAAQKQDGDTEEDDQNWIIISTEEQGFDLLTLKSSEGKFDLLAEADLDEGVYTQVRLKIVEGEDANGEPKTYVKAGGKKYPLKVPSGSQSGLKLVHSFEVVAGTPTVLYLDFDAERSVHQTGNGQYALKPTISIRSELAANQGITGIVNDSATGNPIGNAEISAYTDADPENPEASTLSDEEDGSFKLPLPPGTYTVTGSAEGYMTVTTEPVTVESQVWKALENPIALSPQAP